MKLIRVSILFVSTLFVFRSLAVGATVEFSPQGTIKDVRQVRAQFSDAMVAFGDPRVADPFTVQCPVPGKGLWEDDKNWVYDFSENLSAGMICTFKLKSGLKTFANQLVEGKKAFQFSTGGPSLRQSLPEDNDSIVEDQYFVLALDAKPNLKSVIDLAYFTVEGLEEKVPVEVIEGQEKADVLNSSDVKNEYYFQQMPKSQSLVVIRAKRKFPASEYERDDRNRKYRKVQLVWPKGIASESGVKLEADESYSFSVRSSFYATFSCERENAQSDCVPLAQVSLSFSSPIQIKDAAKIVARFGKQTIKSSAKASDDDDTRYTSSVTFEGPLPANTSYSIELPPNLKDEDGRTLVNASSFPLKFKTAEFPPLAKFPRVFSVIELNAQPTIPVTLRNLEPTLTAKLMSINPNMQIEKLNTKIFRTSIEHFTNIVSKMAELERHDGDERKAAESFFSYADKVETIELKKPNGADAFEVMGISLPKPGIYFTEIESPKLGASLLENKGSYFIKAAALVTNMVVHFKQGRESSIAWVTSLDQGKPVADAIVSVRDCRGDVIKSVKTNASGVAQLGLIGKPESYTNCRTNNTWSKYLHGLYVIAEKDGDFTFTHSSWMEGIETYRFNLRSQYGQDKALLSHTIFDRTLFRAGETVHMKHVLRKHTPAGVEFSSNDVLPKFVQIRHRGTNQRYVLPLTWNKNNTSTNDWKIPRQTKLGTYSVSLLDKAPEKNDSYNDDEGEYYGDNGVSTGEFRVEEFRLPLMKAKIYTPKDPVVASKSASVDVHLEYFSGGSAADQPVQVRYQFEKMYGKRFDDFDGFDFGSTEHEHETGNAAENVAEKISKTIPTKLDKTGTATVKLDLSDVKQSSNIALEFEYTDPNGEIQTASSRFPKYSSSRLIGIKMDGWMLKKEKFKFATAVVDLHGKPVANAPVEVTLHENKIFSHRKKIVGGFYAYESKREVKNLSTACSGKTDNKGYVFCESTSPVSGNLFLRAKTKDGSGNVATTEESFWLWDKDPWMFELSDNDRIDLIPEKKKYEIGQKASFQVRMPFAKANVLVTVEREGILDSFVTEITREKPVIEVPIKKNYSPNVFVSAMVVRGRVGDIQPTSLVDLGRPAYKLGISEIMVDWKPHELQVRVTPEKSDYRVREHAKAKITVRTPDGKIPGANTEVAVAVVDEALLDLKSNVSWDLLTAMMEPRPYEVDTMTAQMQVIGKRHFGLKAVASGGGGGAGRSSARELFDTLIFWSPNIKLDAQGEAIVDLPLNDSLTSFKIVAIANSNASLFGTGDSSIRTNQPISIFSGIPPIAREGDRLNTEITLKNSTQAAVNVDLAASINGTAKPLGMDHVKLAGGESKRIPWTVVVPVDVEKLTYLITALDEKHELLDQIRTTQQIKPAVPVRVFQATLQQLEGKNVLNVEAPKDALPGRGGINVNVSSSLTGGLMGAKYYMSKYPFNCLEQKTSRAIVLEDQKAWKQITEELPSYLDGDGLAKYFPPMIAGSDTLTSYILSISKEARFEIPETVRSTMLEGLRAFATGRISRYSVLQSADLTFRKIEAMEAMSKYGALKVTEIEPFSDPDKMILWPTSVLISMYNIANVFVDTPRRAEILDKISQTLRSRLNFRGTVMGFSTELSDRLWWLMVSQDSNANRFLLAILENAKWKSDVPRLVQGSIARQFNGHWDLTTANAWGAVAIRKFSSLFEKTRVAGETKATLGVESHDLNWTAKPKGGSLNFAWPAAAGLSELKTVHSGPGKPWVTFQSLAAIPLKEPLFKGFQIQKSLASVEKNKKKNWARGDVVRVSLSIDSQADMGWVVVNDPIPAGATILGSGLGKDSNMMVQGEKYDDYLYPTFVERSFEGYRAYYDFIPKGKWKLEYTVRLNQSGAMNLPATRVEAMYAPEVFGELPNGLFSIGE